MLKCFVRKELGGVATGVSRQLPLFSPLGLSPVSDYSLAAPHCSFDTQNGGSEERPKESIDVRCLVFMEPSIMVYVGTPPKPQFTSSSKLELISVLELIGFVSSPHTLSPSSAAGTTLEGSRSPQHQRSSRLPANHPTARLAEELPMFPGGTKDT